MRQTTQELLSDACLFHGCAFNAPTCQTVTTGGIINQTNTTTSAFSQNVQIINATIVPNTFTMRVQMRARIIQSNSNPSWPTILIRNPNTPIQTSLNNSTRFCSTHNSSSTPQPFVALSGVPVTPTFISQNWNNFRFPVNPTGQLLHRLLGYPVFGNLVESTSTTDGLNINYQLSFDLNAVVRNCTGALVETTSDARIYTVPISYVERRPNNVFYEQTNIFSVRIPTTGSITISSVSTYRQRAYPLEVVFPRVCSNPNEAAMRITWLLEIRDVIDSAAKVGPRNISDIVMRLSNSNNVFNCYGDQPISESNEFQLCIAQRVNYNPNSAYNV